MIDLDKYKNIINDCMSHYLESMTNRYQENFEMIDAMKYCLNNESKKLRSIMIIIFAEIFQINFSHVENYILAVEITHTYTLIHDDLPALDDDDFRRNKASAHKKFGEANAILLGDAMQTLAFELISQENSVCSSTQILKVINLFAKCIGGFEGTIYGEFLDINETKLSIVTGLSNNSLNLKQLHKIHLYKTAKLFEFCSMLCGILTNCDHYILECIKKIGINYGLAFQLLDDYDDFQNLNKKYEVNICHSLNREDVKTVYNNYYNAIHLNISYLKKQNYKNIEKLEKFIVQTLKFIL